MATYAIASEWKALSDRLSKALHLTVPPIFLAFQDERPEGVRQFDAPMSAPATDGRKGRVSASCVFWMAVSYTHLDVYKRQVVDDEGHQLIRVERLCVAPRLGT